MSGLPPRFTFRRAATGDLAEAYDWYEGERRGLGDELLAAIAEAVGHAVEEPERYPVVRGDVRRILADRFPYAVYYRLLRGRVVVIAVTHHRRHPRRWQSRR